MPDELGKDAKSVAALQRRHQIFEHDLMTLGSQVCIDISFEYMSIRCLVGNE